METKKEILLRNSYAAKNSVIVVDEINITLWRAGDRIFTASKMHDGLYYCPTLQLTLVKGEVVKVFKGIAKKCF